MGQVFTLCLTPVIWALDLFVDILTSANAVGVYIAFFFIYTVTRLFIRPLLGSASNSSRKERRDKDKPDSNDSNN